MSAFQDWARTQITKLLPLDDESVSQLVTYSASLSPEEAAAHLKNLLGDSPQALEFISSFNARRTAHSAPRDPAPSDNGVPKTKKRSKKNAGLNKLPEVRRPDNYGDTTGGYRKQDDEDYMPGALRPKSRDGAGPGSSTSKSGSSPSASASTSHRSEAFSGLLDASLPNVHTRTASPSRRSHTATPSPASTPRTASPAKPATSTKIAITGGTPMHGASSTLADLDAAIRALEQSTNPTIPPPAADARRCPCMGTLHPLLDSAPNCLRCGKIVCLKEGLAPCTFCGAALLTSQQVQDMVRALRDERGRTRMAAHNAAHARPDVASTPKPFAAPRAGPAGALADAALAQAQAHRDRLLTFQSANAARTRVIDEAAAFETPDVGVAQWGSALQRAAQLKRQQAALREIEWNARPEYEKRRVVVSVDLVRGKVVRKMGAVTREATPPEDPGVEAEEGAGGEETRREGGGAFARNPLLGALIRPVWQEEEGSAAGTSHGAGAEGRADGGGGAALGGRLWRRVQDDANNEAVILDGGAYGEVDRDGTR